MNNKKPADNGGGG
ncbi:putative membrane protein, partial [Yersinia pestis PY-36]